MRNNLRAIFSIVVISHTFFALPFAIVGFFLAIQNGYSWSWRILLLVCLCMFFMRNAAMSFNRLIDAKYDALNPRTKTRDIPQRRISPLRVWAFCIANIFLFVLTTYFINSVCFGLSFIAIVVTLAYSFTKRFFTYTHFILGLALSFSPVGAYLALSSTFAIEPLIVGFAVLCWVSGFDILYSAQDSQFDKEHHLHSIHTKFRFSTAFNIAVGLEISASILLFLLPLFSSKNLNIFYGFAWLLFTSMIFSLLKKVKKDNLKNINKDFFVLNAWASVLFCIFFIAGVCFFRR